MSKRPHPLPGDYQSQGSAYLKRPRLDAECESAGSRHGKFNDHQDQAATPLKNSSQLVPDPLGNAIAALLERSDELNELVRCISSLQQPTAPQPLPNDAAVVRGRLAAVSKQLLPAIQLLASQAPHDQADVERPDTVAVPSHVVWTKWTARDIPESLPPLPEVKDKSMLQAVLCRIPQAGQSARIIHDFDRLEWLGDAYLELFATCFIFETFPDLPHGKCAQMREMLIRNSSLAEWTRAYGLDQRASLECKKTKHFGDLFEAYVGAVIMSDPAGGVAKAAEWLKGVWAMKIAHRIKDEEQMQQLQATAQDGWGEQSAPAAAGPPRKPSSPKEELARLLGLPSIKLRYVDLPAPKIRDRDSNLPLFCIGVTLDGWGEKGVKLGQGTALSKKEAGENAARMALGNRKLMVKYSDMKRAFLEASKGLESEQVES